MSVTRNAAYMVQNGKDLNRVSIASIFNKRGICE